LRTQYTHYIHCDQYLKATYEGERARYAVSMRFMFSNCVSCVSQLVADCISDAFERTPYCGTGNLHCCVFTTVLSQVCEKRSEKERERMRMCAYANAYICVSEGEIHFYSRSLRYFCRASPIPPRSIYCAIDLCDGKDLHALVM